MNRPPLPPRGSKRRLADHARGFRRRLAGSDGLRLGSPMPPITSPMVRASFSLRHPWLPSCGRMIAAPAYFRGDTYADNQTSLVRPSFSPSPRLSGRARRAPVRLSVPQVEGIARRARARHSRRAFAIAPLAARLPAFVGWGDSRNGLASRSRFNVH